LEPHRQEALPPAPPPGALPLHPAKGLRPSRHPFRDLSCTHCTALRACCVAKALPVASGDVRIARLPTPVLISEFHESGDFMRTIFLDANAYATPRDLHLALKMLLHLPDYYGCNADALYDCLSERDDQFGVWVYSPGQGETAQALQRCLPVFEDLGCNVKTL